MSSLACSNISARAGSNSGQAAKHSQHEPAREAFTHRGSHGNGASLRGGPKVLARLQNGRKAQAKMHDKDPVGVNADHANRRYARAQNGAERPDPGTLESVSAPPQIPALQITRRRRMAGRGQVVGRPCTSYI
jgi:hypothetical protein